MNLEDASYIAKVQEVAADLVRQSKEHKYGPNFDRLPIVIVRPLDSLEVDVEAIATVLPPGWLVDVHSVSSWMRKPDDPPVAPEHDVVFARFFPRRPIDDIETT